MNWFSKLSGERKIDPSWYHERPGQTGTPDDERLRVYTIGRHTVTVDPLDGDHVTVRVGSGEGERHIPSLTVEDGEIRIPLDELVDQIVQRAPPTEIARALMSLDAVHDDFVDAFAERYGAGGVNAADRRRLLHKVGATLHSKQLDDIAEKLGKIEWEISRTVNYRDAIRNINETCERRGIDDPVTGKPMRFEDVVGSDYTIGETKIGGTIWTQAREFWRKAIIDAFPAPEPYVDIPFDDPIPFPAGPVAAVDTPATISRASVANMLDMLTCCGAFTEETAIGTETIFGAFRQTMTPERRAAIIAVKIALGELHDAAVVRIVNAAVVRIVNTAPLADDEMPF